MAQHGKHYSSGRTRRTSKKVADATVGTHVDRPNTDARAASQSRQASYRNARLAERASQSQVESFMPTATSGEDQAAYRRRSQQLRYAESVQRRARVKRVGVFLAAALVVIAAAVLAGILAFRGVIGSQMALRDSNAAEALSAAEADAPVYTLVSVELGATAAPLEQRGPDMLVLAQENRATGKLKLMSIPSSLKVTIDNDTRRLGDMADAGDASLISAVESYGKIDVNHFIKMEKGDLAALVDAFGDLEITFNQVIDDPHAGDVYYPAGTYAVNGQGALTYLRASNIKMGRTEQMVNQAEFAKLVLMRLVTSQRGFAAEVETVDEYFQTDLTLGQLEDFARWVAEIGEENITCDVVPGYFTVSSDIVEDNGELYVSKAADFAELAGTPDASEESDAAEEALPAADPSTFTVEVINGTDIVGAAKTTAEALSASGFRIADVGNAEQQVYDETLVIYHTRNTPAKSADEIAEGDAQGETDDYAGEGEGTEGVDAQAATAAESQKSAGQSQEEAEAEERALGESRALSVIESLGIGRVVEGDMYYAFDADVLLIIGYDYKPVA